MAFGFPNPFGGSSDKDKNNTNSSSSEFQPDTPSSQSQASPSPFGTSSASPLTPSSSLSSNTSSSEIKTRLQTAIAHQSNVANAKALISKVNENCFDHCVTSPGSSLSGKEQGCLSACMEKYIDGWNVVSRSYVARLQKEGAQLSS